MSLMLRNNKDREPHPAPQRSNAETTSATYKEWENRKNNGRWRGTDESKPYPVDRKNEFHDGFSEGL